MFRFEKLLVWQKAIAFAGQVYSLTRGFPNDERFGLTSQMRRAAVSVSANIAEGASRASDKDFARSSKSPTALSWKWFRLPKSPFSSLS